MTVGAIAAPCLGLADPAHAVRRGTWQSDVWYMYWSADTTWTLIEPHLLYPASAVIARYQSSGVVYIYGPAVSNPNSRYHSTSYVYNAVGAYVGNYFKYQGAHYKI